MAILVVNGAWAHFHYNAQNKLSKITGGGFAYEFMYDSRNRRVGAPTTARRVAAYKTQFRRLAQKRT